MKRVIIDTDPGIDDAVALLFALGSGALDIRAVTTVSGNLPADRCAANARRVLDMAGATHIPVACGKLAPLLRPFPACSFPNGGDGLGDIGVPPPVTRLDPRFAPQIIIDTARAHAGDITLIGLGPLTNIALAVMQDPALPDIVTELIIVGGAYGFNDHATRRATGEHAGSEWNIGFDPEAAKIVFEAGFRLTAIGLDVAVDDRLALTAADRARLAHAPGKAAWFLAGITDFVERAGFGMYSPLIDSLAIAAAIDRSLMGTETCHAGIETRGDLTRGQTVVDRRPVAARGATGLSSIDAVHAVDFRRFIDLLLRSVT